MGACGSKQADVPAPQPAAPAVDARPIPVAPPAGRSRKELKFQIKLSGKWEDYGREEDMVLKRAYLVGQPNAKFSLRGQHYEYNFTKMLQKNLGTKKEREIRPPPGLSAPQKPLLPKGSMVVLTVRKGQAGQTIELADPNNPGKKIQVNVPRGAKPGQKMAVPVPEKGETVEQVQEKQKSHSTGAKLAMGTAAVAAVAGTAVGGVILGDHLSGGAVGDAIGVDIGGAVAEAGAAVEGAATDVAAAADPVLADVGEWAAGAGEDIGDVAVDAADWLGDAAEDAGDFIMSLF
mmetsp:Transcript_3487/g.7605  ORF Transcript_3487/g.7605 Transcript_3487/m.7605 type:complete len:290 (-) Transcript_3487:386-1255(-)